MTRKEYTAIIEAENPSLGASLRMTNEEQQEEEEEEEAVVGGSSSPGGLAGAGGAAPLVAGGLPVMAGLIAGGAPMAAQTAAVEAEVAETVVFDWEKTDFYDKEKQIVPEDQRSLKPDKKAVLKSVGARPKNPRDRFIHPHAVVASNYLPPPIFPGAYGHGVVTSYLADQNHFIRDEAMLKQRHNASLLDASASSPSNTLSLSPLKARKTIRYPSRQAAPVCAHTMLWCYLRLDALAPRRGPVAAHHASACAALALTSCSPLFLLLTSCSPLFVFVWCMRLSILQRGRFVCRGRVGAGGIGGREHRRRRRSCQATHPRRLSQELP